MAFTRPTLVYGCAIALLAAVLPAHAQEAGAPGVDETQHSEAAVLAVDEHWSIAEMTGDSAWLAGMLMPDYRTVNTDGTAHDKPALLAGATKHPPMSAAEAQSKLADYIKQHHVGSHVVMHGDTAVISFYDTTLGLQKGIASADVFVYQDGRWHALYSQHTGLKH
jgi:hypothetical protein